MAGFFGVQLSVNIANGGAANSLVPNLIARLEPDDKVAVLGLIGAVAAVAAVVTQPLWECSRTVRGPVSGVACRGSSPGSSAWRCPSSASPLWARWS